MDEKIKLSDLVDIVDFYYQESSKYDSATDANIVIKSKVFEQPIFALMTDIGFTAFFKYKNNGNARMARLYTTRIDFDSDKTLLVVHNGLLYKVLRFGGYRFDSELLEYDLEVVPNEST